MPFTCQSRRCCEVNVQHRAEVLVLHAHGQAVPGQTRIVDQNIDLTGRCFSGGEHSRFTVGIAKVGRDDVAGR